MDRNELPLEPRHLGVPSSASKMISDPIVRLAQTVHLSCSDPNTIYETDQNEIPQESRHLGVPSALSKTISKPMVGSAQTVHLSSVKTSTMSKQTKTSFHMTHIALEFHWVCPKQFLSLCYIWRKLCTHLASRLALSPNAQKQASTWASLFRSTIGCVQNDFWAYGKFGTNHAPILHQH
jgi:hypothetical protein